MQKLDRLGWAVGFTFSAYGVRVGVRSNSAELLAELRRRLPFGAQEAPQPLVDAIFSFKAGGAGQRPGARQYHLVYGNLTPLARTHELETALESFASGVQLHIAEHARQRVFVHAGVVGWRGRAILIPGRSFSGKSTLVRALLKAGATYYSDEYAVLDAQGRVHPYPLPIGLRTGDDPRQEKIPVETFGARVGGKPLPVGLIIVAKYRAGAQWRPKLLPPGLGLLALLDNTVSARRAPAAALATLQRVVLQAQSLQGTRGEAEQMCAALLGGGEAAKLKIDLARFTE